MSNQRKRRPRPRPQPAPEDAPLKDRNRAAMRIIFELARLQLERASRNAQCFAMAKQTLHGRGGPADDLAAACRWYCRTNRCLICGGIIAPTAPAWKEPLSAIFGKHRSTCRMACRNERIGRLNAAKAESRESQDDAGCYLPLPEEIAARARAFRLASADFKDAVYCDREDDPYPDRRHAFRYDSDHPEQMKEKASHG